MRPEERAEGIAGLVRHVEMMHQLAGQQAPPRPHRLPVPQQVEPAPQMRDVALGKHLVEVFGPQGVTPPGRRRSRHDPAARGHEEHPDLGRTPGPRCRSSSPPTGPTRRLPAGCSRTWRPTSAKPAPRPSEQTLATLAGYVRIGTDGLYTLAVQCTAPEQNQSLVGTVWAVQPSSGGGRFVNRTLSAYLRSLALLVTTRQQMQGMDPYAAGAAVAAFQEQIAAIDSWALDDDGNWWSLVIEQMWHGLF